MHCYFQKFYFFFKKPYEILLFQTCKRLIFTSRKLVSYTYIRILRSTYYDSRWRDHYRKYCDFSLLNRYAYYGSINKFNRFVKMSNKEILTFTKTICRKNVLQIFFLEDKTKQIICIKILRIENFSNLW